MTSQPVRVVARVVAHADKADEMRSLLLQLIEPTRRESGCLFYDLFESTDRPYEFVFVEEWRSAADLDAHLQSDHIQAALVAAESLFAAPPGIQRYRRLA